MPSCRVRTRDSNTRALQRQLPCLCRPLKGRPFNSTFADSPLRTALLFAVTLAAAFDYIENLLHWCALPDFKDAPGWMLRFAGYAGINKWILLFPSVALLMPLSPLGSTLDKTIPHRDRAYTGCQPASALASRLERFCQLVSLQTTQRAPVRIHSTLTVTGRINAIISDRPGGTAGGRGRPSMRSPGLPRLPRDM